MSQAPSNPSAAHAKPPSIRVRVDPANPGQFFACCGLLELADRLWPGAEGWFEQGEFCMRETGALHELVDHARRCELELVDKEDIYGSPARLSGPFELTLDWWRDDRAGGNRLKPWAGTMQSVRIAEAMQATLSREEARKENLFDFGCVVPDPQNPTKKVEPYYFDARRKENAHPRDVGFSPNDFGMTTIAFPAVEFFCLVGLQRCRPKLTSKPRVFDYWTWTRPLKVNVVPAAVVGLLHDPAARRFRFENAFRTGQRKHKAFAPAIPFQGDDHV